MISLQDLPVEILEHILAFLRLEDWKQASLVCQQWMLLCASRKCLANDVLSLVPENHDRAQLCLILSNSIRKYRNIFFEVFEDEDHVIPTILETFQASLECVKIKGYYEMVIVLKMNYIKRLFERTVKLKELRLQAMLEIVDPPAEGEILELPIMPRLETLYLEYESLERASFNWSKIAPNVKHLYLAHNHNCSNFNNLMRFYSQKLRSLGIALDGESHYSFGVKPIQFPQVRKLTVSCWSEIGLDKAQKFYRSFPSTLTELTLGYTMESDVFASIFALFQMLETVRLYFVLPGNGLQLLSKLPKLKRLYLCRASISYSDLVLAQCFNNLQELSLKFVEVDAIDEFFQLLPDKMPHVTALEMTDDGKNETSLVCANLSRLERLTVSWEFGIQDYFSCGDFHRLGHLHDLRLFYNSTRNDDFSLMSFACCPSVRHLLIADRLVTLLDTNKRKTSEWQAIALKFPFLEILEIAKGSVTLSDAEIIKNLLPCCDVRIVTNPVAFLSENVDAALQFEMAI